MKTGVGGTFNVLHSGHKALLDEAAASGGIVCVAVMSDDYATSVKQYHVPLDERIKRIEEYLSPKGCKYEISVIDTAEGTALTDEELKTLIVSPETLHSAERINEGRMKNGLSPFEIILVPHVTAEDCLPISSSRVLSGEIDENGKLLRPLKVAVGSLNKIKIDAVSAAFSKFFENVEVTGYGVSSDVPEQPREEETRQGAINRAHKCINDADYGVGLEAGVFETVDGLYDVQYCVIVDKAGKMSIGHGSGFRYPDAVWEKVNEGWTVGDAFNTMYEWKRKGMGEGAIGCLTNGVLTRTQLSEQAVIAALVPRINRHMFPELSR